MSVSTALSAWLTKSCGPLGDDLQSVRLAKIVQRRLARFACNVFRRPETMGQRLIIHIDELQFAAHGFRVQGACAAG